MRRFLQISACLACAVMSSAFVRPMGPAATTPTRSRSSTVTMKWSGDRPPATNPLRLEQKIDASYDRGVNRNKDYMASDMQNPLPELEWWKAYLPSEEEIEAAAAGYDFANPEKWLAEKAGKPVNVEEEPHEFVFSTGMNFGGPLFKEMRTEVSVPAPK